MAKVEDPDLKRVQASLMLAKRIQGEDLETIAREFKVTEKTVRRRLDFAKREGLLEQYRDSVWDRLLPLAMKSAEQLLLDNDKEITKAVLFGTGVLEKKPVASKTSVEMTINEWREQRKQRFATGEKGGVETRTLRDIRRPAPAIAGEVLGADDDRHGVARTGGTAAAAEAPEECEEDE
jgi:hypothetical protein